MNAFEAVRQNVTARMAAKAFGIKVSASGMACCPFHEDKYPSLKLDTRFYCFGCLAHGDTIDFAANYLHLGKLEAAERLAEEFHLDYEKPKRSGKQKVMSDMKKLRMNQLQSKAQIAFDIWVNKSIAALHSYEKRLSEQRARESPQSKDAPWSEAFSQILRAQEEISGMLSILESGTLTERIELYNLKRRRIEEIGRQLG